MPISLTTRQLNAYFKYIHVTMCTWGRLDTHVFVAWLFLSRKTKENSKRRKFSSFEKRYWGNSNNLIRIVLAESWNYAGNDPYYAGNSMMMMIALISFNSSLVPLIEGLCSSNPWEFEFSGFRRNRIHNIGINGPSLWPIEPRLHVRSSTSCERARYRVLRQWLWTGFEHSLQCGSLAEPPEACAERNDNVISDPQSDLISDAHSDIQLMVDIL